MILLKNIFILILMFIIINLLSSCGSKIEVEGVDDVKTESKIGPDFEGAANFCDTRYGKLTQEAEACFEDYRNYFKINIELSFNEITDFCEEQFTNQSDIDICRTDLLSLLINIQRGNNE